MDPTCTNDIIKNMENVVINENNNEAQVIEVPKPKKPKPILYIGLNVPEDVKQHLIEKMDEHEELKTQFSTLPNKYMHHLTLQFGKKNSPEGWDQLLALKDATTPVTITHIVCCDKLMAFKCQLTEEYTKLCQTGTPHITIATNEGIKPFESTEVVKNMHEHKSIEFNFVFDSVVTHF